MAKRVRTRAASRSAAPSARNRKAVDLRAKASEACEFVQGELRKLADPDKASVMAAYMKTTQPFWGVQKPDRVPVARELGRRFRAHSAAEVRETVERLWSLPHREAKYLATDYAMAHKKLIALELLPLYETMIRTGAWWDLVDPVAIHLVGAVYRGEPKTVAGLLDRWIDDGDLWIRRSAIIAQIRHKALTDERRLFRYCRKRAREPEFFVRKAIGWALREYSYHAPEAVEKFLIDHRDELSGLSLREGSKQLRRIGLAQDLV